MLVHVPSVLRMLPNPSDSYGSSNRNFNRDSDSPGDSRHDLKNLGETLILRSRRAAEKKGYS
jgi:hypothetical protein